MTGKAGQKAASRRPRRGSKEIRRLLLDAATVEFQDRGYRGATTAAVARRANVTEAQLFRYFPSKADLFRAAIFEPLNDHFRAFLEMQEARFDGQQDYRAAAEHYIAELQGFMRDNSQLLMALFVAETYSGEKLPGVAAIPGLEEYFARGAATMASRTEGRARVAPELMVRVSFAAVMANILFKDWLFPDHMASPGDIAAAIADFTIDGISANNPTNE